MYFHLPVANLVANVAMSDVKTNGKYIAKLLNRHIIIEVSWPLHVELLKWISIFATSLLYILYLFFRDLSWEIIVSEVENFEVMSLFMNEMS